MSRSELVVLKFGSSVLPCEDELPVVVGEIRRHVERGERVIAVVSAIGDGTKTLLHRAGRLGWLPAAALERAWSAASPPAAAFAAGEAALAALLATGEATTAALLGLALDVAGIPATVLDVGRVGPFTRGPQLDAEPCALDARAVRRALAARPVAVIPGFLGRDEDGHHSLLGRGGSDLTALFFGRELGGRCRLLKDVDGIYEHDPAQAGPRPRRYAALSWEHALRLDDRVVQRKAIQFAYRNRLPFTVGRCAGRGTLVGAPASRFAGRRAAAAVADDPARTGPRAPGRRSGRCTHAVPAAEATDARGLVRTHTAEGRLAS